MHKSYSVFLINDDVRAIAVSYEPGEHAPTTLFKSFDKDLEVGDYVVIETNSRHNMTVAKVAEVDVEIDFNTANDHIGWIVGAIDNTAHLNILEQEEAAHTAIQKAETRKKRDELKEAMFKDHEEEMKKLQIASPSSE